MATPCSHAWRQPDGFMWAAGDCTFRLPPIAFILLMILLIIHLSFPLTSAMSPLLCALGELKGLLLVLLIVLYRENYIRGERTQQAYPPPSPPPPSNRVTEPRAL